METQGHERLMPMKPLIYNIDSAVGRPLRAAHVDLCLQTADSIRLDAFPCNVFAKVLTWLMPISM